MLYSCTYRQQSVKSHLGYDVYGSEAELLSLLVLVLLACHTLPCTRSTHAIGPCIVLDRLLHSTDAVVVTQGLGKTRRSKYIFRCCTKRSSGCA